MNADSLLDLATDAAHQAGRLLLERFGGPARGVSTKSTPTDLVSDADRDSEKLLLEFISKYRPDDGVLSEESGAERSRSGMRWIIDPLDGTVNYLFGIPVWAVSIAIQDEEQTVAGVIFDPNSDETYRASRGGGATVNGHETRVSNKDNLSQALVGTGFSYDATLRAAQADVLERVIGKVRDIRRAGSASIDLAWVSCGRLDAFFEADMHPWDTMAGELLVAESGGMTSPLAAPVGDASGVLAAGPSLHGALRDLVS